MRIVLTATLLLSLLSGCSSSQTAEQKAEATRVLQGAAKSLLAASSFVMEYDVDSGSSFTSTVVYHADGRLQIVRKLKDKQIADRETTVIVIGDDVYTTASQRAGYFALAGDSAVALINDELNALRRIEKVEGEKRTANSFLFRQRSEPANTLEIGTAEVVNGFLNKITIVDKELKLAIRCQVD